jgi:hypothetical protein
MQGFPFGRYSEFTPLRTIDAAVCGGQPPARVQFIVPTSDFCGNHFGRIALQYKQR